MTDRQKSCRPLAVDAVVFMLSPTTGEVWSEANLVVAAALLVELSHQGRLVVSGRGQTLEVAVADPTPLGDDLLDEALQIVAASERSSRVTKLITMLPKSDRVLERLVAEGTVTAETQRKWGMMKVQRHYPTPAAGQDALRAAVREAFHGTSTPDTRSAQLLSVLAIGRMLKAGVPSEKRPDMARRLLAVRDALDQDEAALVSTIDEVVRRANNTANNAIGN